MIDRTKKADLPVALADDADAAAPPAAAPQGALSTEDRVFVERLRRGDEAAFSELIERHHGSLRRVALLFVSTPAVAEEVAQETWLAVVNGLERFEGRSSLRTWLFRILTNRARTRGAREARSVPFGSFGELDPGEPAVEPERFRTDGRWARPPRRWEQDTPERVLLRREALRRLQDTIETLPESQRAVLTLRDLEGMEAAEVCNILEISETNQRVLLHRARSRVRRALDGCLDGEK